MKKVVFQSKFCCAGVSVKEKHQLLPYFDKMPCMERNIKTTMEVDLDSQSNIIYKIGMLWDFILK